jgi:hypothetical protein
MAPLLRQLLADYAATGLPPAYLPPIDQDPHEPETPRPLWAEVESLLPELPTEAIYVPPRIENFCWRIEQAQIREGGFAMIHGDPGTGKSVALRLLAERLARLPDITVGAINHPQSNLVDFYREMGDIFAVPLRPHNRWGGFKALRESGSRIWRRRVDARCCWSMRRRR